MLKRRLTDRQIPNGKEETQNGICVYIWKICTAQFYHSQICSVHSVHCTMYTFVDTRIYQKPIHQRSMSVCVRALCGALFVSLFWHSTLNSAAVHTNWTKLLSIYREIVFNIHRENGKQIKLEVKANAGWRRRKGESALSAEEENGECNDYSFWKILQILNDKSSWIYIK